MVRQAWKTMVTGRPGPVVLDVPFDVFKEAAAEETPKPEEWSANISSRCGADPDGVKKAVDMLLAAERPVILVGQGVKYGGAADDLLALAEKLQIPVAHSTSGIGAIDTQHPLSLGLVSRGGAYQANHAARQADVLLALGVRFDDRTSSSWIPGYSFTIPPTKLIHVDIDPDEIGRNYPVALGLMADVRTFLRQVLAELDRRKDVGATPPRRAGNGSRTIDGYRKEWDEFIAPGFTDDSTPIHPQRAASEIDKALPDDAILVSDIGVHHNWLLQFCKPKRPDSLIGSMGFGADGLRRRRRARRQARGAGPALRVGVRRRRLLHARQRARHRGRIQSAGRLGGLEQLRLCVDPRLAARLSRRPRACHRLQASARPASRYNPDFAAMARSAGVEGVSVDRAGDLGDAVRGHRRQQALPHRRQHRRRQESRRRRRLGTARPRRQQAGDRRAVSAGVSGRRG